MLQRHTTGTKTEVLVPRAFIWWTYIALARADVHRHGEIKFVREWSGAADRLVVDASLLNPVPIITRTDLTLSILLWNGYESFLAYRDGLAAVAKKVHAMELLIVGDLWPISFFDRRPCSCSLLFPQDTNSYEGDQLRNEPVATITFSIRSDRWVIRHRGTVISAKVFLQLLGARRLMEYATSRYVFCGQSGLYTLRKYAAQYGMTEQAMAAWGEDLECPETFVLSWLEALVRARRDWSWDVVARAFLRFCALRILHRCRRNDLFLHLALENNLNAYQAGLLFRRHVFLDFGGIHGNEAFYPRRADLAIFHRKVLRFDTAAVLQRLKELTPCCLATLHDFLRAYEADVISRLDACSAGFCSEPIPA